MATNNFDALLDELDAAARMRPGELAKALLAPAAGPPPAKQPRAADVPWVRVDRLIRTVQPVPAQNFAKTLNEVEGILRRVGSARRPPARPPAPTMAQRRAAFTERFDKALAAGSLTAVEAARLEARIHHLQRGAR